MGQSTHNPLTSGRRAESLLREFLFIFFLFYSCLLYSACLLRLVPIFAVRSVTLGFFCLLLFSVCCLLRESFAVLEQCYSTAFVPRTLRSLIFFRYSERFVFYLFFSVVSFADFILLRYLVIFCFFIKDSLFDQLQVHDGVFFLHSLVVKVYQLISKLKYFPCVLFFFMCMCVFIINNDNSDFLFIQYFKVF